MKRKLSIIEKLPPTPKVKTVRKLLLEASIEAKKHGYTKAVVVMMNDEETIDYNAAGISAIEKIAMLDIAKQLTTKRLYGG